MKERLSKLQINFHAWVLLLLVAVIAGATVLVDRSVRLHEVHYLVMRAPIASVALTMAAIVFLQLRQRWIGFVIGLVAGILLLPAAVIVSVLLVAGGPPT